MYNSQNLPLSPKKVVKKSLPTILIMTLLFAGIAVFIFFLFKTLSDDLNTKSSLVGFDPMLILLTSYFILGIIVVIYEYLYYKSYYYNFEDDTAEIRKGVLEVATGHVRYSKIQNIFVDQDIWDRIFGLYDVHYETAGEASGFYSHVDGLNKENADKLTAFLNERVLNKDSQRISTIEQNNTENAIDNSDERIFNRENIPVDKKVIWSMISARSLVYAIFIFYMVVKILSDQAIHGRNTSDVSVTYFLIVFLAIYFLAFLGSYIYALVWYKNFYFKFDGQGGVITEKVISVKNKYVYYNRIQNIDVSQGIVDRLFGLNKVVIETAAEGSKLNSIKISGLRKEGAETLKNFLLEKSRKYQSV